MLDHGYSLARERFDDTRPKLNRTLVSFENADDPPAWETLPQPCGDVREVGQARRHQAAFALQFEDPPTTPKRFAAMGAATIHPLSGTGYKLFPMDTEEASQTLSDS